MSNLREELGISALFRTNPTCGFEAGSVVTDAEYNEVSLHQADVSQKKKGENHHGHHEHSHAGPQKKTFSFDSIVDDLKVPNKKDKNEKAGNFASQEMMWGVFEREMDRRMQDASSDIGVVALGIPGSGKTYTLFGGSSKKDRGLVPRFVEKSFKKGWTGQEKGGIVKFDTVLLSMYVTIGEHLVDVFRINNPLALHTGRDNFAYSDTLGPLVLPVDYVCCDSAQECNGFISLGLRVAAAVIAGHTEVYSSASIHVRMLMVSQEKDLYKVNFVEAPSLNAPKTVPVNVDRLSGASQLFSGVRELYEGVKEAASNSMDAVAYTKEMLKDHARRTIVQYVLQDVVWRHPECIVVACSRGHASFYADNVKVCELVDAIWANQLRPSDVEGDESVKEKEGQRGRSGSGGRTGDRNTGGGDTDGEPKLGPKFVVPLKEAVGCLKAEARAGRERMAAIDEQVRDIAAAAAEKHAQQHGHDGLPMPPLPPPRPRLRQRGLPGDKDKDKDKDQVVPPARLPRRDRQVHPNYEYTPPDPPSSATGAEREILTLQAEQRLLEGKDEYLCRYEEVLQLLLTPSDGGKSSGKGEGVAGVKGVKYRLNHTPCYVPTFPSARSPSSFLLYRDCVGDPYDSEEEERAERVRELSRCKPLGLQYFAQVMQEWLVERGISVPRIPYDSSVDRDQKKVPIGGLDLGMFSNARKAKSFDEEEDDDEEGGGDGGIGSGAGEGESKSSASRKRGGGGSGGTDDPSLSQITPWSSTKDPPHPYLVPMSPHSGLQEHYCKISVAPGKVVVVRGVTGLCVGLKQSLDSRYSSSPIDTDYGKDQSTYLEALGDLMGEGLLPVEDYWEGEEKEREKAEAALRAQRERDKAEGGASVATQETEEEEDEDDRALRQEKEKKEEEERRKEEANRAIISVVVNGPDISPLHCFFRCENQKTLTVRPNTIVSSAAASLSIGSKSKAQGPSVAVNGSEISETVPLVDMDVVRVGTRYFLVRVPVKLKKANDPVVIEESLFSLSKWELSMLRSHAGALRKAIEGNLLTRLHLSHAQSDRSLLAVLKQPDKTRLNSVPDYDIPTEAVAHIYKGISPLDRVYLSEMAAACLCVNVLSRLMRRGLTVELALGETSAKDQKYKKIVRVRTAPVDIFTQPVDPHAMQTQVQHSDAVHSSSTSASSLLGLVTNTGGRTPVKYRVRDKDRDNAAPQNQVLSAYLTCTSAEESSNGGKFVWNPEVAAERLYLLLLMHRSFNAWWCSRDPSWLNILYPPALDPSNDAQEDELIGVGYLYLDSFQHLIDVNDIVPLVSVDGSKVGHLKVRGRVWIDKMETSPAYLTVDAEKHVRDFENRLCILRLYFESLIDLPDSQCSSTYVKFNFFYHSKPYTTLRHGGLSTHPFLHSAIKIEQRITGDFLEYIDRGSLELEVYGKRKKVSGPAVQALRGIAEYRIGEEVAEEAQDEEEDDEGEEGGEAVDAEDKQAMSEADLMVQSLAAKLERTEELLAKSKDTASQAIADRKELERKLAALKAAAEAGEGSGPNKRGSRRGQQEQEQSSTCAIS